jgi:hypothetical protein
MGTQQGCRPPVPSFVRNGAYGVAIPAGSTGGPQYTERRLGKNRTEAAGCSSGSCSISRRQMRRVRERVPASEVMNPDAFYFCRVRAVVTMKPTSEMAGVTMPTRTSTEKLGPSVDCAA